MYITFTVEVPNGALSILRTDEDSFSREMRLAAAMKWYELGMVSQGKAAELAGVSRAEFLACMGRFHVSPFQVTPDQLDSEFTSG